VLTFRDQAKTYSRFGTRSAMSVAKMQLCVQKDHSSDARRLLERVIGNNEETDEISTMIRDSVLGVSHVTLQEALAMEPSQIDVLDDIGYSPLHWAARRDDIEKVDILLRHGAKVNVRARRNRKTPLHLAAYRSSPTVMSLLIDKGADLHAKDFRGYTPLHCSVHRLDNARSLLRAGADPNIQDMMGTTPLHLSTVTGCEECVEVNTPGDIISGTPIIPAVLSGSKLSGASATAWPYTGITADTYTLGCRGTVTMNCPANHDGVISALIEYGAKLDATDWEGKTPLMHAVVHGNTSAMSQLYASGSSLSIANKHGNTTLDYAAVYGGLEELECLRALHTQGIDPDCPNETGHTSLDLFHRRTETPWLPGTRKPTHSEVFVFHAMIVEMRRRNWDSGHFLESKALVGPGSAEYRALSSNLGRLWQMMKDKPEIGSAPWAGYDSPTCRWADDVERADTDYDTSILYKQVHTAIPEQCSYTEEVADEETLNEEFFDALE